MTRPDEDKRQNQPGLWQLDNEEAMSPPNNPLNLKAALNKNTLAANLEQTAREIARRGPAEWTFWVCYILELLDAQAEADNERKWFNGQLRELAAKLTARAGGGSW